MSVHSLRRCRSSITMLEDGRKEGRMGGWMCVAKNKWVDEVTG